MKLHHRVCIGFLFAVALGVLLAVWRPLVDPDKAQFSCWYAIIVSLAFLGVKAVAVLAWFRSDPFRPAGMENPDAYFSGVVLLFTWFFVTALAVYLTSLSGRMSADGATASPVEEVVLLFLRPLMWAGVVVGGTSLTIPYLFRI